MTAILVRFFCHLLEMQPSRKQMKRSLPLHQTSRDTNNSNCLKRLSWPRKQTLHLNVIHLRRVARWDLGGSKFIPSIPWRRIGCIAASFIEENQRSVVLFNQSFPK